MCIDWRGMVDFLALARNAEARYCMGVYYYRMVYIFVGLVRADFDLRCFRKRLRERSVRSSMVA